MLTRKLFRTAWNYRIQFISMILMITLGMGIFLGFNMEWYTIEYDTSKFFENTRYADYRLYSNEGFTKTDIEQIKQISGVDAATRFLAVNLDVEGEKNKSLSLDVSEDYTVTTFTVTSGAEYDPHGDGFWLSDKFASENGLSTGDTLTLSYQGMKITGQIVGLIKAGEHMICLADTNQLMPDFKSFGYAYISPDKLSEVIREKLKTSLADELKNKGVPSDIIAQTASEMLTDELIEKTTDKIFSQINICSDMEKSALEESIKDKLGRTIMVTSKTDHISYQGANSEADEGKTMGSILPVLFLAIAILTMVTTMHRIATKEKLQIGTLKALGFKNRHILIHYTSYGLFIGIVGTGLGAVLGYCICKLIMNENGIMGTYFDMPDWTTAVPAFCYPVMICTVLLLTMISFLSVRRQLRGTAANALRPYVPKKVKKTVFEKLKGWDKLSFGTKWNIRDMSRNKSRAAMTLVGIIGCMVLIVGGLGMRDTLSGFIDLLDKNISNYATKVNLIEGADKQKAKDLAYSISGDWESLSGISLNGDTVTLDIIHSEKNLYNIIDESNNVIEMKDDGVYLCLRLKDHAKIGEKISFSPYGSDKTYSAKVLGYNRSIMTQSVTMTDNCADKMGIEYTVTTIYTDKKSGDIQSSDIIAGKQDKSQFMDTFDGFVQIFDSMVIIIVIGALILGIVVLYNLGIMSYVERSREFATLKVLGFRNRDIGKLLISQNIWLTVVGVFIGLPAGVGVLEWLLYALAGEYELKLMLGITTYTVSVILTFGMSLLVGLMIMRKNKKIDMVEALKISD